MIELCARHWYIRLASKCTLKADCHIIEQQRKYTHTHTHTPQWPMMLRWKQRLEINCVTEIKTIHKISQPFHYCDNDRHYENATTYTCKCIQMVCIEKWSCWQIVYLRVYGFSTDVDPLKHGRDVVRSTFIPFAYPYIAFAHQYEITHSARSGASVSMVVQMMEKEKALRILSYSNMSYR